MTTAATSLSRSHHNEHWPAKSPTHLHFRLSSSCGQRKGTHCARCDVGLLLCLGVIGKTPGLISRNNFVKITFICIGHCDNVLARCDSIFPLLRCQEIWNKMCTQLSLSQILFQNLKDYSLEDVQRFCYHS